jgi:hypothetical protein
MILLLVSVDCVFCLFLWGGGDHCRIWNISGCKIVLPYETYRTSGPYLCLCHQLLKSHCLQLAVPASPLNDRRLAWSEFHVSADQTLYQFGHSLTIAG